jgi:hypothetical protein
VLVAAGCSQNDAGVGRVTGTVTFRGEPLTSGDVTFVCPNGETRGGSLTPKGAYTVDNIPAGPVKIAIYARGRVPKGFMTKNAEKNAYVAIPSKYADPEKSGLIYQVKPGDQEFAIVLPP